MERFDLMTDKDLIHAIIERKLSLEYVKGDWNLGLVGELEDQVNSLSSYLQHWVGSHN